MTNPYTSQPDTAFWARSVARLDPDDVDPVSTPPFRIHPGERVATAGSCFAQHISRALRAEGHAYLITEEGPEERGYGVYPARFGNIYTARQMLQLFQRAFGLFTPADQPWRRGEAFVDRFRPQVEPEGFVDAAALNLDQARHLAAVRRMFEAAEVLIFTLGLTEAWVSTSDGAVTPLAPGVAGGPMDGDRYEARNFTVEETVADLRALLRHARVLRPELKAILTVSPVPLIATSGPDHVLCATAYSKAVLRVAAQAVAETDPLTIYFPSFEIVTGLHNGRRYFAEDLRSVRPEGVARVMSLFKRHLLASGRAEAPDPRPQPTRLDMADAGGVDVLCDEEAIDP